MIYWFTQVLYSLSPGSLKLSDTTNDTVVKLVLRYPCVFSLTNYNEPFQTLLKCLLHYRLDLKLLFHSKNVHLFDLLIYL